MIKTGVVIIGSGISGLCMAIKLQQAGITDFIVLEKSNEVGGTWHDNTYPGACCDVPAALYSFSFEPNPNWSRVFAPQHEIQQYLLHCADKYRLRQYIQFNREVTSARYLDSEGRWLITLNNGEQINTRVVISALGQLNRPNIPAIDGADAFRGLVFHTARWNNNVDFSNKRVAVIGNAASAIQLIPELAKKVSKLYIYQRSANYILPRNDRFYSKLSKTVFRRFPLSQKIVRLYYYLFAELIYFGGLLPGSLRARFLTWLAKQYRQKTVKDSRLWETLSPDYVFGCKRVLISDDYYPALNNGHVEIVTSLIKNMTEDAICSEDQTHRPVDIIVYATGFRTMEMLAPMVVVGKDGLDVNAAWKDGAQAHRGVALSGFPNFYMLYGPNTNLGHNSIIFMVEQQAAYIVQCVRKILDENIKSLQPKEDAQKKFNEKMQDDLGERVWSGECGSWYKNDAGKITQNWPHSTMRFAREMRAVNFNEYDKGF